jgi:hypothetical protein
MGTLGMSSLFFVVAGGVAFLTVLPDIRRYMKIRCM